MIETIKTPPEYREYLFRKYRRAFPRSWLRTSLFACVPWLCFLVVFYFKLAIPAQTIILLAPLSFVVSAGLLSVALVLAKFQHSTWKWDDDGIRFSRLLRRWTFFQGFRVDAVPGLPGVVMFCVQTRDRFLSKGVWIGIIGRVPDIERLAECARNHGLSESPRTVSQSTFP